MYNKGVEGQIYDIMKATFLFKSFMDPVRIWFTLAVSYYYLVNEMEFLLKHFLRILNDL